jgi:hypothetical protein
MSIGPHLNPPKPWKKYNKEETSPQRKNGPPPESTPSSLPVCEVGQDATHQNMKPSTKPRRKRRSIPKLDE